MNPPIIGVSMNTVLRSNSAGEYTAYLLRREYVDRIREAGGTPILLPPGTHVDSVIEILDGWLIPGGDDIDPTLWDEQLHAEAVLENRDRLDTEKEIFEKRHPNMPILGICYGCQLLNVLHGGSLHQHIPDQLGHDQHRGDTVQNYEIDKSSLLAAVVGQEASGKSWHHQAIDKVGNGIKVTSQHEDGTIEAIEHASGKFIVGVQWHPERSDSEATPKLFKAFVEKAREFQVEKQSCGTW